MASCEPVIVDALEKKHQPTKKMRRLSSAAIAPGSIFVAKVKHHFTTVGLGSIAGRH